MSKFARATQTSQSLSLAAMEEASRLGLREADIEHMFLALVISDQVAGRVLRDLGITLEAARQAVGAQHEAQLASVGVEASFPTAGRIVFHETAGYQWSRRSADLIARAGGKAREGDAAAVLRELVSEPSGLITDILHRLGTTPREVLERLDEAATHPAPIASRPHGARGRVWGSTETFVPAPIAQVWEFLADPVRVPEWETSVGSIEATAHGSGSGGTWDGRAPAARPDGRPLKLRAQFRRRRIELVAAERPDRVEWRFTYPDAVHVNPIRTAFSLASTRGGTQVTITTSWRRRAGWRRIIGLPLRPLQKFVVWISLFQTGGAVSRAFR